MVFSEQSSVATELHIAVLRGGHPSKSLLRGYRLEHPAVLFLLNACHRLTIHRIQPVAVTRSAHGYLRCARRGKSTRVGLQRGLRLGPSVFSDFRFPMKVAFAYLWCVFAHYPSPHQLLPKEATPPLPPFLPSPIPQSSAETWEWRLARDLQNIQMKTNKRICA